MISNIVSTLTNLRLMIIKFLLSCLYLNVSKYNIAEAFVSVIEVSAGRLAQLPCLSNDDTHRFMFWQLPDDKSIIGPGSKEMDENKYNYEVLSGKLLIREVSSSEAGFYKCISKGLEDYSDINIHIVKLVVKKDNLTKNSFETNFLSGMTTIMIIVVVIAVILLIIMLKQRRTYRFFDILEESRENSPVRYTSSTETPPTTATPKTLDDGGVNNIGFDVDFPKLFQQMQKGQTIPLSNN